jgi:hypothetical protein
MAVLAAHLPGPPPAARASAPLGGRVPLPPSGAAIPAPRADGPAWSRQWRRLWLDGREIRWFRRLAPRQMPVLDTLEAAGWPAAGVPNPFRKRLPAALARRRLHETVTNLNRKLQGRGLRLREDGRRVWWEGDPAARASTRKYA